MKNSYPDISYNGVKTILQNSSGVMAISLTAYKGFGPDWYVKKLLSKKHTVEEDQAFTSAGFVWKVNGNLQFWENSFPTFQKSKWEGKGKQRLFFIQDEKFTQKVKSYCVRNFLNRKGLDIKRVIPFLLTSLSYGVIPWGMGRSVMASEAITEATPAIFKGIKERNIDPMEVGNILSQFTKEIYDLK